MKCYSRELSSVIFGGFYGEKKKIINSIIRNAVLYGSAVAADLYVTMNALRDECENNGNLDEMELLEDGIMELDVLAVNNLSSDGYTRFLYLTETMIPAM